MQYKVPAFPDRAIKAAYAAFMVLLLTSPTDAAPAVLQHDIPATTADPAAHQPANKITGQTDDNFVAVASVHGQRKGRLFLFIDGTATSPAMTKDIALYGAERGYNVISVAYPNNHAIAQICDASEDPDCSGKVREEVLTGHDLSPQVSVREADAIEPRVRKLLAYLSIHYPEEGWGKFLHGQSIDWSIVSVAGHSQGAGYAAMLAKRHKVFRMLMISGVADVTQDGAPAPWLSRPGATPAEREYGLTNVFDPIVRLRVARAGWKALGLDAFGPIRSVSRLSPPIPGFAPAGQYTTRRVWHEGPPQHGF